mmetsp:Transcript_33744/g.84082  ORF Transcript_33744/g.84082 Transcript_33744/m.84082 type:complete len:364 (+) Transcript_33744:267-1358(+)
MRAQAALTLLLPPCAVAPSATASEAMASRAGCTSREAGGLALTRRSAACATTSRVSSKGSTRLTRPASLAFAFFPTSSAACSVPLIAAISDFTVLACKRPISVAAKAASPPEIAGACLASAAAWLEMSARRYAERALSMPAQKAGISCQQTVGWRAARVFQKEDVSLQLFTLAYCATASPRSSIAAVVTRVLSPALPPLAGAATRSFAPTRERRIAQTASAASPTINPSLAPRLANPSTRFSAPSAASAFRLPCAPDGGGASARCSGRERRSLAVRCTTAAWSGAAAARAAASNSCSTRFTLRSAHSVAAFAAATTSAENSLAALFLPLPELVACAAAAARPAACRTKHSTRSSARSLKCASC